MSLPLSTLYGKSLLAQKRNKTDPDIANWGPGILKIRIRKAIAPRSNRKTLRVDKISHQIQRKIHGNKRVSWLDERDAQDIVLACDF